MSEPRKILLIDDDRSVHEVLGAYLSLAGLRLVGADDGAEGLAAMARERPDLVLLDISLPGMDGFTVYREAQRQVALAGIPVIFVSSHDRPHLRVRGLELGAEDFVTKPFDRAELLARVRAALRRGERAHRAAHETSGTLGPQGLVELLSACAFAGRSAVLELPGAGGEVGLHDGHPVYARWGEHRGAAALLRLALAATGDYRLKAGALPAGAPRDFGAPEAALSQVAVALDDLRALTPPDLQDDPWLAPDVARVAAAGVTLPALAWPARSSEVVVRGPEDLAAWLRTLAGWLAAGVLRRIDEPAQEGP